jgi:preprotein translocase subunit SecF
MELFRETNINFLRWKWWAIGASWALILVGLLAIFVQKGLRFGIDFAGGTQIALKFRDRPDIDHLRKLLDAGNFGDTGIQRYEAPEKNEVLVRVQQQKKEGRDITAEVLALLRQGLGAPSDTTRLDLNVQGRDNLAARLVAADPDRVAGKSGTSPADYYAHAAEQIIARRSQLGIFRSPSDVDSVAGTSAPLRDWIKANTVTGPFVLLSAENVGPQVGADLRKTALWAIATSMLGMLIYIGWRFRSLPFGVGAVVALIHDTLITVGLLALFGREFNLVVVAAILTRVG